jgi:hypothetical protein
MVKVATPILYESSLDELNRVRPLKLSDRNRLSFGLPVLSKNPVGTGRPIIGKFARCDNNSALLRNAGNSFKNFESYIIRFTSDEDKQCFTFAHNVFGILLQVVYILLYDELDWCNSNYSYSFYEITKVGNYFLPFKGKVLYMDASVDGDNDIWAYLFGFY